MAEKLFNQIREHITAVIAQRSPMGKSLWQELITEVHPADIAEFIIQLPDEYAKKLLMSFPHTLICATVRELSVHYQVFILQSLNDKEKAHVLACLTADELTDLFDELSDTDLKKYLSLLHKSDRDKVISLLEFDRDSAGGSMDTDVLAMMEDFTVQESIKLIQRLQEHRELHHRRFVVNKDRILVGYILLEDLVLRRPEMRLNSFMRKNEFVVDAHEDRESVAHMMVKYNLMVMPVVDQDSHFLGVISSSTLVDIIEQKASEDVYRMSAMSPVRGTYFEMSLHRLLYQRSGILLVLLLVQSISSMIIKSHKALLYGIGGGILIQFASMLTGTGGNASSQTSAIVIQGFASGEINDDNIIRFFRREFILAFAMACILGIAAFVRVFITSGSLLGSIAVSLSLVFIIIVSIMIGCFIPVLLRKINVDPAYSAGPFLATLMDIFGLLIYCTISQVVFNYLI